MNMIDPMVQRLAIAQSTLLEPAGLKQSDLLRALACIAEHRVDDADLYFQYTRSEAWSLDEGIVKSGSFSIDQGLGVRAVQGEKTAFSYADGIGIDMLMDAARATRSIARRGGGGQAPIKSRLRRVKTAQHYGFADPIAAMSADDKVALLQKIESYARARDPRIRQVMASLAAEWDVMLVARLDGSMAADVRPLIRLSVSVIVEQKGRREQGYSGGGGRFNLDYFTEQQAFEHVDQAVDQALLNLEARPADRGIYAVNFGGGQVDITNGKFVFGASEAWWVEKGKKRYPVKGATLIGNGPEALTRVTMIGNDMKLDPGVGTCGKDGQSVPVGVGQPTLRIEGLTVGGTA
ncbi:MAG: metalloprotease TldD [Betaproteobacteria bacterium]|nr:metalloprotease TldD [Betaproteobacteria bacterium]